MMRGLKTFTICAAMLAVCGCGPHKASTPRQALENMRQALVDGNGKRFAECYVADAAQKKFLVAACGYLKVSAEFEKKLTAAYSTNAVERGNARSRNLFNQLANGKTLEDVQIKVDGETATATLTNYLPALVLAKQGGVWRIRVNGLAPPFANDMDEALATTAALTEFTKQAIAKIGKPGESAAKIREDIRTAILQRYISANAGVMTNALRTSVK
jgi:hypothetical protein